MIFRAATLAIFRAQATRSTDRVAGETASASGHDWLPMHSPQLHGVRSDDGLGMGPSFSSDSSFLRISASRLSGGTACLGGFRGLSPGITCLVELLELEVDVAQMLEDRGVGAAPFLFHIRLSSARRLSSSAPEPP